MRNGLLLLLCSVSLLLSACRRGPAAAPAAPPPINELPEAARMYYDNGGGIQDSLRLVVRDRGTLQQVWARATSRQPDPPPVPPLDFERDMLLVVAAGRMTPEDEIHVDSIGIRRQLAASGKMEDVLAVVVRVTEGCRRLRADAYPVEIVRVRRFSGDVQFVERREKAQGCRGSGS